MERDVGDLLKMPDCRQDSSYKSPAYDKLSYLNVEESAARIHLAAHHP